MIIARQALWEGPSGGGRGISAPSGFHQLLEGFPNVGALGQELTGALELENRMLAHSAVAERVSEVDMELPRRAVRTRGRDQRPSRLRSNRPSSSLGLTAAGSALRGPLGHFGNPPLTFQCPPERFAIVEVLRGVFCENV